jgi:hypothetical protein
MPTRAGSLGAVVRARPGAASAEKILVEKGLAVDPVHHGGVRTNIHSAQVTLELFACVIVSVLAWVENCREACSVASVISVWTVAWRPGLVPQDSRRRADDQGPCHRGQDQPYVRYLEIQGASRPS